MMTDSLHYIMEQSADYAAGSLLNAAISDSRKLTDAELLSVLFAEKGTKPNPKAYGDCLVMKADSGMPLNIPVGLTQLQQARLSAVMELGSRMYGSRTERISAPHDAYMTVRHYAYCDQEQFIAIALDGGNRILSTYVTTRGLVNRTLVHPRETFAPALRLNATSVIVAHNHPSGLLEPSAEDISSTARLTEAGGILGIKVLDHLIFSTKDFFSMKEHGLL